MLLKGNPKLERSSLNAVALEKSIYKEVERVWALPLTIYSLRHIKNAGFLPLGLAEKFSIINKGERYTERRVAHDC